MRLIRISYDIAEIKNNIEIHFIWLSITNIVYILSEPTHIKVLKVSKEPDPKAMFFYVGWLKWSDVDASTTVHIGHEGIG